MPKLFVDHPTFESEEVLKKYENGVQIVVDEADTREEYWVIQTKPGEMNIHEFKGYEAKKNAKLCAELLHRGGRIQYGYRPSDMIPVSVALLNNAAIAAYLRIVEEKRTKEIAEKMGFRTSTISQYLSDFAEGRR